jgi:hypothetical protein
MGCEVTFKTLKDEVGNKVKAILEDGLSLNGKEIKYGRQSRERSLDVFVPFDSIHPSTGNLWYKMKEVATKLNKEYLAKTYGTVATVKQHSDGVTVIIHPAGKLVRDMNEKERLKIKPTFESITNEYEFEGEIYPSVEERSKAMDRKKQNFLPMAFASTGPTSYFNTTNYADYIEHKENLLKNVINRIGNLTSGRKYDNSLVIKKEIAALNKLKENLEIETNELLNSTNILARTMSAFNSDLAFIDKLLSSPTPSLENIHYAEGMVNYFELISDYSKSNKDNLFVVPGDSSTIEPDVLDVLNKLKLDLDDKRTAIYNAKLNYLVQAIEASENLKSLFPNMQAEEIRAIILKDTSDIGTFSKLFATVDKEFGGDDSILAELIRIELERSRNIIKPQAATISQKITEIQDKVKSKLIEKGKGITYGLVNKLFSEVTYDMFYQKTGRGNKTGNLISKFSTQWYKDISNIVRNNKEAMQAAWALPDVRDMQKALNDALINKYNSLNDKVDFVQLGKLPEIINNPDFQILNKYFNPAEADLYKQQLIDSIGEYAYNKMVISQKEALEDFMVAVVNEKQHLLDINGVRNYADLEPGIKMHFEIFQKRNNPFEFIESHLNGQEGRIDHVWGTSGNQYQSHLKYNTYTPKKEVSSFDMNTGTFYQEDSGYFDKGFDEIQNDPTLLEFWEIMAEATEYMNSALTDSNTNLSHTSLLKMSKSMTDILFDRQLGVMNKSVHLLSETGQSLKNMMSANVSNKRANDVTEVNKAGIETVQEEVKMRFKTFDRIFEVRTGKPLGEKSLTDLSKMTLDQRDLMEQLTGLNQAELITTYGKKANLSSIVKEFFTNQIMEEQTFNLPVMMKSYLDVVSEYKAQKASLPKINIYKDIYDNIQLDKNSKKGLLEDTLDLAARIRKKQRYSGIQDKRVRGQERTQNWINKNVKGVEDSEYWVKFGKNLNEKQKEYEKATEAYLKKLKNDLAVATSKDAEIAIEKEIADVEHELDNLGRVYTGAAIYNAVINRLGVFVGLAYNIPSQFFNRYQGWHQGMINDTGRYWTPGNFYAANAFINRKFMGKLGFNKQKQEIRKVKLLTEKMGFIQDNTNELDRARRESGVTGWTRKLNPFYLTEYVEWHNQVPQALSILMDQRIISTEVDSAGNPIVVPIFDGNSQSFPAHTIKDGKLVLKDAFRTPENIATWESFSNEKYAQVKGKITETIALLNGDYTKTGNTEIKSYTLGKTFMMFKTWMSSQMFLRFAKNQTSVTLGIKDFDGAYAGGLSNVKTNVAATFGLSLVLGVGALTTLGLPLAGTTVGGLAIYSVLKNRKKNRVNGQNLEMLKQLYGMGKAIVNKMIGLPVNTLSGKNLIKAHTFKELNVTEADRQNLNFIVNELVALLWMLLVKVIIKNMKGDDEEEEPKTLDGKTPNPAYYTQEDKDSKWILLENMITRLIQEGSTFTNAEALYKSATPAGIDSFFTKVADLTVGLYNVYQGSDVITSGDNIGESKTGNALKKFVVPGIINEFTDGNFDSAGFSKYEKKDWNPNEFLDNAYTTDYKRDLKIIDGERAVLRAELTLYWNEEYEMNEIEDTYTKKTLEEEITKRINEEVNATYPRKIRLMYDEDQQLIE